MTKLPDHGEPTRQNPEHWTTLALEYLDQGVTVFD